MTPEEAEIACRAVEGGFLDDLRESWELEEYGGEGTRPNTECARQVGALLGRWLVFPWPVGDGWASPGWRTLCDAICDRFNW